MEDQDFDIVRIVWQKLCAALRRTFFVALAAKDIINREAIFHCQDLDAQPHFSESFRVEVVQELDNA